MWDWKKSKKDRRRSLNILTSFVLKVRILQLYIIKNKFNKFRFFGSFSISYSFVMLILKVSIMNLI